MHTFAALRGVAGLVTALAMAGCANTAQPVYPPRSEAIQPGESSLYSRGVVQSIDLVHLKTVASSSILGPDLAQTADAFKFTILMDDHSYQTMVQTTHGDLRVGDRVQVGNGAVRRY